MIDADTIQKDPVPILTVQMEDEALEETGTVTPLGFKYSPHQHRNRKSAPDRQLNIVKSITPHHLNVR
jgi:hypothetical protein